MDVVWSIGAWTSPSRHAKQCYAAGHAQATPRARSRCFRHRAYADTLVSNVNGIQVGADGQLQHFTGCSIGDDGKVRTVLTGPPPADRVRRIRSTAAGERCCPG